MDRSNVLVSLLVEIGFVWRQFSLQTISGLELKIVLAPLDEEIFRVNPVLKILICGHSESALEMHRVLYRNVYLAVQRPDIRIRVKVYIRVEFRETSSWWGFGRISRFDIKALAKLITLITLNLFQLFDNFGWNIAFIQRWMRVILHFLWFAFGADWTLLKALIHSHFVLRNWPRSCCWRF